MGAGTVELGTGADGHAIAVFGLHRPADRRALTQQLALIPSAAASAEPGMEAVAALLTRFRLEQYIEAFDEQGYDDVQYLLVMDDEQANQLVGDVGMKQGHAHKFKFMLGREKQGGGAA